MYRFRRLVAQLTAENYQLIDMPDRLKYFGVALLPDPDQNRRLPKKARALPADAGEAVEAREWAGRCVTLAGLPALDWSLEVHDVQVVPQRLRLAAADGAAAGKGGSRVLKLRVHLVSWGSDGRASVAREARAKAVAASICECRARSGTGSPTALTEAWHGGVPAYNDHNTLSCDAREQFQKKISLIDYGGSTACEMGPKGTFKHGAHLLYTSQTLFDVEGGDKAHVQRPHFLHQMLLVAKPEQPTLVTPAAPTLAFVDSVCLLANHGTLVRCSNCRGSRIVCPPNFLPGTELGVGCGCGMVPNGRYELIFSGAGSGASATFVADQRGIGIGIDPTSFNAGDKYKPGGTTVTLPSTLMLPTGCVCQLAAQVAKSGQLTGLTMEGTDASRIPATISISALDGGSGVVLSNALPAGEWPVQLQGYASLEETSTMTQQFTDLLDAPWFVLTDKERRVGFPGEPWVYSTGDSMWKMEECGGRPSPTDACAPLPLWKCTERMMRTPEGQRECEPLTTEQMDVFGTFADISFLRSNKDSKVSCARQLSYAARMQPFVDAAHSVLSAVDSVSVQLDPKVQVDAAKSNSARAAALRVAQATPAADGLTEAMESMVVDAVGSLQSAVVGVKLTSGQGKEIKRSTDEMCDAIRRQVTKAAPVNDDSDATPRYKAKAAVVQNLQALSSQLKRLVHKLQTSGTTKKGDLSLHPRGALKTVSDCTILAEKTITKISAIQDRGGIIPGPVRRAIFGSEGALAEPAAAHDQELKLLIGADGSAGIADETSGFGLREGVVLLVGGDDTACSVRLVGCATAVTLTGDASEVSSSLVVTSGGAAVQPRRVLTVQLAAPLPAGSSFPAGSVVKEGTRKRQEPLQEQLEGAAHSDKQDTLTFPTTLLPAELHLGGWLKCGGELTGVERVFTKNSVRNAQAIAGSAPPGGLIVRQAANGLVNPLAGDGLFNVQVGRKASGRDVWSVVLDPAQADSVAVRQQVERFGLQIAAQPAADTAECWYDPASITCSWDRGIILVTSVVGFAKGQATLECPATSNASPLAMAVQITDVNTDDVTATYGGARASQQYEEGAKEELGYVWSERLTGASARFRRKVSGSQCNFKDAVGVLFDDGCYLPYAFSRAAGSTPSSFTHLSMAAATTINICPADSTRLPASMGTFSSIRFHAAVVWPAERPSTDGCTLSQSQGASDLQKRLGSFERPPTSGPPDPTRHLNVLGTTVELTPTTALSPAERARVSAGECFIQYDGPARFTAMPQIPRFASEGRELLDMALDEIEPVLSQRLTGLATALKTPSEDDECLRAEHEHMSHSVLLDFVLHLDDAMHSSMNCMRTGSCNKALIFAASLSGQPAADVLCQTLCQQGVSCGKKQYASAGAQQQCKQYRGGVVDIFTAVSIDPISEQLREHGELWALAAHCNKEIIDLLYMGPVVAETKYFCTDDGTNRDAVLDHGAWVLDTWIDVQLKLNPGKMVDGLRCIDSVYTRSCVQMVLLMRNQFLKGQPPKGVDVPEIKNAEHRESVRAQPTALHIRHVTPHAHAYRTDHCCALACGWQKTALLGLAPERVSLQMLRTAAISMIDEWRSLGHDLARQKTAHFRDCRRSKYHNRVPRWQCRRARHACCKAGAEPDAPTPCQTQYGAQPGETFVSVWHPVPKRVDRRAGHYTCEKVQIHDVDSGCHDSYRAYSDPDGYVPPQGDACTLEEDEEDEGDEDEDGEGGGGQSQEDRDESGRDQDDAEREEVEEEDLP